MEARAGTDHALLLPLLPHVLPLALPHASFKPSKASTRDPSAKPCVHEKRPESRLFIYCLHVEDLFLSSPPPAFFFLNRLHFSPFQVQTVTHFHCIIRHSCTSRALIHRNPQHCSVIRASCSDRFVTIIVECLSSLIKHADIIVQIRQIFEL